MAKRPVQKTPLFEDFVAGQTKKLQYQEGASNKSYFIQLQTGVGGQPDDECQIYSEWGRVGAKQTREWRYYDSIDEAEKDFVVIVKSKTSKGYIETA